MTLSRLCWDVLTGLDLLVEREAYAMTLVGVGISAFGMWAVCAWRWEPLCVVAGLIAGVSIVAYTEAKERRP